MFLKPAGVLLLCLSALTQIEPSEQRRRYRLRGCRDCSSEYMESSGGLTRSPVSGAAKIRSMTLTNETSSAGTCVRGTSFGFLGAEAFVDMGCAGEFRVCYVEGRTESVTCSSTGGSMTTCDFSRPCDVRSISVVRAPSDAPCLKGYSYTVSSTGVTVCRDCQATFTVGCRACS